MSGVIAFVTGITGTLFCKACTGNPAKSVAQPAVAIASLLPPLDTSPVAFADPGGTLSVRR
jgi:hypothetical protein